MPEPERPATAAERLERELRALLPLALLRSAALGPLETSQHVIRVVMRCAGPLLITDGEDQSG